MKKLSLSCHGMTSADSRHGAGFRAEGGRQGSERAIGPVAPFIPIMLFLTFR
jgi:hypothetical protein